MKNLSVLLLFFCMTSQAQVEQLVGQSYLFGRDYYVLRSGRAKMVIQCDNADVGPAFSYMLFDSFNTKQTSRKSGAFNYVDKTGFLSTALEVILKNYPFTALGHNTVTSWTAENGIPSVEAVWWASGLKVREVITPISVNGVFRRTITLESADLVAEDTVRLRLSLHTPAALAGNNVLIADNQKVSIALSVSENNLVRISSKKDKLEIGPIIIKPGQKKIIVSYLILEMPSRNLQDLLSKAASVEQWIKPEETAMKVKWVNSNVIKTKDEVVRNMYDKCRFILPSYVADNGTMDAGIFEYGAQWVRDASNTTLGMIHIGEFELARAMLDHMLKNMILANGTTMIGGGFDDPDREQFDQMGEFMHAMKSYVDWTGDTSLITGNRDKLIAMVERPLNSNFRDSTGMVHNRREFWERTFDDAYELAYQTWVIQGLRDAAGLSKYLNAESQSGRWLKEAGVILNAMLTNPRMKLVDNDHLIKRRNTSGELVDKVKFTGWLDGAPAKVESLSRLMPDATMALPIAMDIIDPESALSKNTLNELEKLWNERWFSGGYDRYNTSSQGDQPGPWTFATTFILRAQHEAHLMDLSRRSFEWLCFNAGGRTGAYFEEIPIIRSQAFSSGLLPWTSAEISYFIVQNMLGIKFAGDKMIIKPALYPGTAPLDADIRYHNGRINLVIDGSGPVLYATINGINIKPKNDGSIEVPDKFVSGTIRIFTKKN
jgi:hypothetical protein